jgi:hypothetical protein
MTKCACGFEFVPDKPLSKPVEAICSQCGATVTLQPEASAPVEPKPVKTGRKEIDS